MAARAGGLASLAVLCASAGAGAQHTIAHYAFQAAACAEGQVDELSTNAFDRILLLGPGSTCNQDHIGVTLDGDCCCDEEVTPNCNLLPRDDPLMSAGPVSFGVEVGEDGFTIEAWVRPEAAQSGTRVIASLGPAEDVAQICAPGSTDTISFALLQTNKGCVQLQLGLPESSDKACKTLPTADKSYCTIVADEPRIDLENPRLQHVVVSLSREIGTAPTSGDTPRFAIYIDGVRTVNSDALTNVGSILASIQLGNTQLQRYAPNEIWHPDHVLRIGSVGSSSATATDQPWSGEMFMFRMLSHSVNTSQTASLLASGLPNSAPVAQDAIVSLAEDTCAPLPTLTNLVSDWDIGPPLYRAQTLSIQLNVTSLTRGSLHDDAACASAALSGSELPYRAGLHYRPRPDEYGADYDVLKWSVSDNTDSGSSNGVSNTGAASESVTGGSHNASAVLRFNVSSVNDAPIAHDTSATVYVDFPQMLRLNGSDVDETSGGTDGVSTPTDTLATHSFSVSTLPSFGELHSLNAQGGLGPPLALGALTPGVSLFYTATADFGDTSGQMVLGSDFFDYVIIDALGATSALAARFTLTIRSGLEVADQVVPTPLHPTPSLTPSPQIQPPTSSPPPPPYPPYPLLPPPPPPQLHELDEDALETITLRGLNLPEQLSLGIIPGIPAPAAFGTGSAFLVLSLPQHGQLFAYDARRANLSGGAIESTGGYVAEWGDATAAQTRNAFPCGSESDLATDSSQLNGEGNHVWLCVRLRYRGAKDYFSSPQHARDGTPLNQSDDSFGFALASVGPSGVGRRSLSASPRSAAAEATLRIHNVLDPPILFAPTNTCYTSRLANYVTRQVVLEDPDLGVGCMRLELSVVGPGYGVSEQVHRQRESDPIGWEYWQQEVSDVAALLGYCPPMCQQSTGTLCKAACTAGNGLRDNPLRVFCTSGTAEAVLRDLLFEEDHRVAGPGEAHYVVVTLEAFDDGRVATTDTTRPVVRTTAQVPLRRCACDPGLVVGTCTSADGDEVAGARGGKSGVMSYTAAALALCALIGIIYQLRERLLKRKAASVPKPSGSTDAAVKFDRLLLACASIGVLGVLAAFAVRCRASPYTLFRLDFSGDGQCGVNVTVYAENGNCTSGVPEGFEASRCLGDVFILGLFAPLALVECSARGMYGRLGAGLLSASWLLASAVRYGAFDAWDAQVAEEPWSAGEGKGELLLGEEIRPHQNSYALWIWLATTTPPLCLLGALSWYVWRVTRGGGAENPPPPVVEVASRGGRGGVSGVLGGLYRRAKTVRRPSMRNDRKRAGRRADHSGGERGQTASDFQFAAPLPESAGTRGPRAAAHFDPFPSGGAMGEADFGYDHHDHGAPPRSAGTYYDHHYDQTLNGAPAGGADGHYYDDTSSRRSDMSYDYDPSQQHGYQHEYPNEYPQQGYPHTQQRSVPAPPMPPPPARDMVPACMSTTIAPPRSSPPRADRERQPPPYQAEHWPPLPPSNKYPDYWTDRYRRG